MKKVYECVAVHKPFQLCNPIIAIKYRIARQGAYHFVNLQTLIILACRIILTATILNKLFMDMSEGAREFARMGGNARAAKLSPAERKLIAQRAIKARWSRQGKLGEKQIEDVIPYAMLPGELHIGKSILPCYVLNDHTRVLTQTGMVLSLGMSIGQGDSGASANRLGKFIGTKSLSPYIEANIRSRIENPIIFKLPSGGTAYGYEATLLPDICNAVLQAREDIKLQANQMHIAKACEILIRSFAKIGIIALIDEVTGYQRVRQKHALQLKLQAFIADELQEWALTFPQEFWFELARLEGINYSAKNRPLRWGKYIMMFVYDAIDKDIGKMLRAKNPNPRFKQNHHQWLKKFGKDKVHDQLQKVITIMKLCKDMDDFREKFARVFDKSPGQMSMDFSD